MRVAIVCPYAWSRPGGVQSHVRALARALRGRSHHVLVVAPRSRAGERPEAGMALVGRAVPVPANGSVAALAFGPGAALGVRKAVHDFAPDVLHVHEPLIPSLSLLALASGRTPAVGTFHAAAVRSAAYRAAAPALRLAARRLAARTAVSEAARAFVARYFPGDYVLTPNGIEVDRFASAQAMELGPGRKVLFLGRLERRKGIEVLIQAMAHVRDLGATLLVAGGSGPQERAARRLADDLDVRVRWLGLVSEDDKPSIYKAADVYCAPGLGGESFGIVLLEAMAAGAPVVCSDLPGYRAVVGDAGVLTSPGEAGAVADALRRVLNDAALARRMAETGRKRSLAFDWSTLAVRVEDLYSKVAV